MAENDPGPASILVVDDERGPRESLQLILKPRYRVFTAESGEKALEVLRSQPIDVVTLDLKMAGLSGSDTLAAMRELDPSIEVIVVTGYGSYESAVEVLRLRAFDYIPKPFESRRILEVVGKALDARRQRLAERQVERLIPPLSDIVEDVERWQRTISARLGELDRAALDRILNRLKSLRAELRGKASSAAAKESK